MEDNGGESSPFWMESNNNLRLSDRYRRRLSSVFLSSGALLSILLVVALLLIVFVIPSILSFTCQIFKPNIVKKSWNSINLVLVLLALLFGFICRGRGQDYQYRTLSGNLKSSNSSTPHDRWYGYSDSDRVTAVDSFSSESRGGLTRTFSSYPDLRYVPPPWTATDDHWRFYDDTQLNAYRYSESGELYRRRSWREFDRQDSVSKDVLVDTFVARRNQVSYDPPPPPPSPPDKQKVGRSYRSVARKGIRNKEVNSDEDPKTPITPQTPATPPPPPPPPPPFPSRQYLDKKRSQSAERKRGSANTTRDFMTSLYHKKKKKKQTQRSADNLDALLYHSEPNPLRSQKPRATPPPPPPPPPPSSVLHTIFSKRKRTISVPPQRESSSKSSTSTFRLAPVKILHPRSPVKTNSFESVDDNPNSGGQSPLIPIPPPPPPPPFKMPTWKFVVQGDYVRIQSDSSSPRGSDFDDSELSPKSISQESNVTAADVDVDDGTRSPLFCPSPNVDVKADSFIAKFKAGLKLERINSAKRKQGRGLSNLGPRSGPSYF